MCGSYVEISSTRVVIVEGAPLRLCPRCYERVAQKRTRELGEDRRVRPSSSPTVGMNKMSGLKTFSTNISQKKPTTRTIPEEYDVVDDFGERVRKAREAKGWTITQLAEKIKEPENVIRRIEQGKLRPTIELAKKLEEVLGVKLLIPLTEESYKNEQATTAANTKVEKYPTLGEVVKVRVKERSEQ